MAAITWANVVAFEALVATVPVEVQTALLAYVNNNIKVSLFGDGESDPQLYLTRVYLAAHLGLGAVPSLPTAVGGGAVASLSGGDGLAVSYAVDAAAVTDDEMNSTAWGRKYLSMVRRTPGARAWVIL